MSLKVPKLLFLSHRQENMELVGEITPVAQVIQK